MCQQGDPFACGLQQGMNLDFGEGLTAKVENQDIFLGCGRLGFLWRVLN